MLFESFKSFMFGKFKFKAKITQGIWIKKETESLFDKHETGPDPTWLGANISQEATF